MGVGEPLVAVGEPLVAVAVAPLVILPLEASTLLVTAEVGVPPVVAVALAVDSEPEHAVELTSARLITPPGPSARRAPPRPERKQRMDSSLAYLPRTASKGVPAHARSAKLVAHRVRAARRV